MLRELPTPEETALEFATPTTNEYIALLDANYAQSRVIIENLIEGMNSGLIDPNVAHSAIEEELGDLTVNAAEILDVDIENVDNHIDDDTGEYLEAEDSPTMGHALRVLIDHHYGNDDMGVVEGLNDIAECAGVSPSTAADWYNDDDMPTAEQCQLMLECFPELHADELGMQHFVSLAGVSDRGDFSYSQIAPVINRVSSELNSLKAERAEFNLQTDIQNRIRAIERKAESLYNAGVISPVEYRLVAAQDINSEDKADFCAYFSSVAEASGSSATEYLGHLEFAVNLLEQRGPIAGSSILAGFNLPELDESGNDFISSYRDVHSYT